jgi:hypothetical protein
LKVTVIEYLVLFLGCFSFNFLAVLCSQHYPPGTQEYYNSFSSRNLVMGKGKELEFPEGRGGGKGAATQSGGSPYYSFML